MCAREEKLHLTIGILQQEGGVTVSQGRSFESWKGKHMGLSTGPVRGQVQRWCTSNEAVRPCRLLNSKGNGVQSWSKYRLSLLQSPSHIHTF